ncbi:MAG: hypothetical protein R2855_12230 [Thermomicrobiales bacterium]
MHRVRRTTGRAGRNAESGHTDLDAGFCALASIRTDAASRAHQPDALYLHVLENGDVLGPMAWPPDDALPQAAETGPGALLMHSNHPDDIYMMIKTVGTSTGSITETTVNGEPAWWIEGASNLTIFGEESIESRSTANVLLWQQGGIGFRLESALSIDEALAIAESLEPVS